MTTPHDNPNGYDAFDGLVFDCDGTLADTMPAHYRAWSATAARYGLDFPEDRFYALGGVPARDILLLLSREQGVTLDADAAAHEKETLFASVYLDHTRPVEPVAAIARRYHGIKPLAVATGGVRPVVTRCLTQLGLIHLFETIVSSEDVRRPKPAPDTYLLAAERLGLDPRRCCAFEDTDLGLTSARDAGMTAVDIRPLVRAAGG